MLASVSTQDTMNLLSALEKWMQKKSHSTLNRRAAARGVFGTPDKREMQIHFMQGIPGIGYERASSLVAYFEGLPVTLSPDARLTDVPGLGKKSARQIEEFFNG